MKLHYANTSVSHWVNAKKFFSESHTLARVEKEKRKEKELGKCNNIRIDLNSMNSLGWKTYISYVKLRNLCWQFICIMKKGTKLYMYGKYILVCTHLHWCHYVYCFCFAHNFCYLQWCIVFRPIAYVERWYI